MEIQKKKQQRKKETLVSHLSAGERILATDLGYYEPCCQSYKRFPNSLSGGSFLKKNGFRLF